MPVADHIEAFGRIGARADGVTRLAWSEELAAAHDLLRERLQDAGLVADVDAAGNVIGRWEAGSKPAVVVGSHLDTVPGGGRYDGALGVLAGLSAVEMLRERGFEPSRPLWLVSFMDEEGARFNTSMLGSRAFVGEQLATSGDATDASGTTLRAAMASQGRDFDEIAAAAAIDRVACFLELHIEQGPTLEEAQIDLGIVEGCSGASRFEVRLDGARNHAGTTPLGSRRDALVGASRIILALRSEAQEAGMVVTVGEIAVEPGTFNIIPGTCVFSVDVRTPPARDVGDAEEMVRSVAARIAAEETLDHDVDTLDRDQGVAFDHELLDVLERSAARLGATHVRMASGAGHDAMVLARHAPAAMLFVPSRGGVSHSSEESTSEWHCELGARVLADALETLAGASRARP